MGNNTLRDSTESLQQCRCMDLLYFLTLSQEAIRQSKIPQKVVVFFKEIPITTICILFLLPILFFYSLFTAIGISLQNATT